jgi:hypothetical protein
MLKRREITSEPNHFPESTNAEAPRVLEPQHGLVVAERERGANQGTQKLVAIGEGQRVLNQGVAAMEAIALNDGLD